MSRTASWVLAIVVSVVLATAGVIAGFARFGRRRRSQPPARMTWPPGFEFSTPPSPAGEREAEDAGSPAAAVVHEAIAEANRLLRDALERGDAHAYAANFVEDGLSLPGHGAIVRGREALVGAMTETFYKMRFLETDLSPLDLRLNGETALETGSYRYVVAANKTGVRKTLSGRYVIAWKRVSDRWKIALEAVQPEALAE